MLINTVQLEEIFDIYGFLINNITGQTVKVDESVSMYFESEESGRFVSDFEMTEDEEFNLVRDWHHLACGESRLVIPGGKKFYIIP